MAAEHAAGLDSDSEDEGAPPAVVVWRDEEDIDSSAAARLAADTVPDIE